MVISEVLIDFKVAKTHCETHKGGCCMNIAHGWSPLSMGDGVHTPSAQPASLD